MEVKYLLLFMAILIPIFVLVTAIVCARMPKFPNKWKWMIAILLGVGGLTINLDTGELFTQLLRISLLSVSVMKYGQEAPWFITVAFPLGAVLFWKKRNGGAFPDGKGGIDASRSS